MLSQQRKYYIKKLALLGAPVAFGQVGHVVTSLADTVMVGQLGGVSLAAVGFANAVFFVLFIFGIGVISGITPLVGKADAEGNNELCKQYLFHGVLFALVTGIVLTAANVGIAQFMHQMGQEPAVADEALYYFYWLTASIVPAMIFMGVKNYIEGLGHTTPPMVVTLAGNLINIILNYILIFGKLGFAPMGIVGAGVATLISRILSMVFMIAYAIYAPNLKEQLKGVMSTTYNSQITRAISKIGIPIGLQYFVEINAFTIGAIMAGWVGSSTQAAHHIVIQLCALTFLISSGIGTAGTIVISNHLGKKEYRLLHYAGNTAFIMTVVFMSFCAVIFTLGHNWLPHFFIDDPKVIAIAGGLLFIGALFQLFDGFQVTAISALRGIGDVNVPTIIAVIAYWFIGIPFGYILAIKLNMGGPGIWWGYLIGLGTAAVLLFARFQYSAKKLIAQFEPKDDMEHLISN